MIESGLSQWVKTNPALQKLLGQTPFEKTKGIWSSFYFSYLPKADLQNTPIPGIVVDVLSSEEQCDALDARSANPPYTPIERIFQFGSVAIDGDNNPWNYDGYLSVAFLSQTLYRQLMELADGNAPLPDGTIIQNVRYLQEYDAHYEIGDKAYLMRRMLHLAITYIPSPAG